MQCLKAIGTAEALDVVRQFLDAPVEKKAESLDVACEIAGVTRLPNGVSNSESCRSNASMVTDKLGAHYMLIKGGSFTFSLTKKQETVEDIYVAKYTVTNKHYRRFIGYLDAKEAALAAIVPLETYTKALLVLAEGIKGFSVWLQIGRSMPERFRSPAMRATDNRRGRHTSLYSPPADHPC